MQKYWGYHTIANCGGCDLALITDRDNIANFARELVRELDMVPYGEPQIVNFGSGDKAGYTLVQLIETSNICAHFVNDLREVYVDVFSCKPYNPLVVEVIVSKYFGAETIQKCFLERKACTLEELLAKTND